MTHYGSEIADDFFRDRSSITGRADGQRVFLRQLARAALSAMSRRCFAVRLAARARPPFGPPSRPSDAAYGFFWPGWSRSGTTTPRTASRTVGP